MEVTKSMLLNWWERKGRVPYTPEELKKFEQVIDDYGVDKVLEVAISSYIAEDGSPTVILECIRRDAVEEFIKYLPDISTLSEGEQEAYEFEKEKFIRKISKSESPVQ